MFFLTSTFKVFPSSDYAEAYSTLHEKCSYSEFFWSAFSRIVTEYGEILRISLYSVQMRENTDQKNSEYGHFSRSRKLCQTSKMEIFEKAVNKWIVVNNLKIVV